jgi:outer membrane biosynthesis protein TonB
VGPMGLPEVENRWESGEINPGTLAWHPGMDDWVPIQDIPKLRYLLGSMESREVPESVEAGAASPAPVQEEEWAPSSGSSLSSLVEQEIEAVKDSKPPPAETSAPDELPDEPEGGALAPWEKEEPVSGEVARPKESFFDSSLDQPVTDSGGGVVRAGRGLARPAYLSEGSKGGLNKKWILIGSISLVVLIVIGVVVFKVLQEPPEEEVGKMAAIEKPAGENEKEKPANKKDEKAKTAEAKKEEEKKDEKETKPEEKSEKEKKDVLVVGKEKTKPVKTPATPKKPSSKKKRKKIAKAGTKPKEKSPSKPKTVEAPTSSGGGPTSATLSKAQIATTMKKYIRAMKGCVQQQQQRDPSVTGTMLVSFVINGTGKVSLIKILSTEHKGTYVAGCITYIIKSMKFPKFSGDPITIPRVPLRLGG